MLFFLSSFFLLLTSTGLSSQEFRLRYLLTIAQFSMTFWSERSLHCFQRNTRDLMISRSRYLPNAPTNHERWIYFNHDRARMISLMIHSVTRKARFLLIVSIKIKALWKRFFQNINVNPITKSRVLRVSTRTLTLDVKKKK